MNGVRERVPSRENSKCRLPGRRGHGKDVGVDGEQREEEEM